MKELTINKFQDKNLKNNTPILFNKKLKKIVTKPLVFIKNDTGKTRHFTPAAQEWYNSVYAYNHNYIRSLPAIDKNIMSILRNYFTSQIAPENPKAKRKFIRDRRFRRLSTKKVFIGKGDVKHTNKKVTFTFYIYDTEILFLYNQFLMYNDLFFGKTNEKLIKESEELRKNNKKQKSISKKEDSQDFITMMESRKEKFFSLFFNKYLISDKITPLFDIINSSCTNLISFIDSNKLTINSDGIKHVNKKLDELLNINAFIGYENVHNSSETRKIMTWKGGFIGATMYQSFIYKEFIISYYLLLNHLKKLKMVEKLPDLINKLYGKEVVFNVVNLSKMHLSSDIYTQAVALKLKNRKNKLYRVLKASLRKVKLDDFRRISALRAKPNKTDVFVNKIRNSLINSMSSFSLNNNVKDPLNNLLLNFFPSADNLKVDLVKRSSTKVYSISIQNYVLTYLKHLKIRGIRVEAKGRLTKRIKASRSVFKMKYKGGLKNVDSSFRGLSAIMLRGHVKSNVEYSLINSKNRLGAFGIKGWVSSK